MSARLIADMVAGTVAIGQGRRVCLQHPDDETRTKDKCIPLEEGGTNVLVFSDQDVCGCCDGACPTAWKACECSGRDRDNGADFTGVWMSVPGYHHHWWGGSISSDKCVRIEDTVDTQLRGGSCYDTASCPPVASTPAPAIRKRCKCENRGRMQNENKRINR
jgi:hypothetical protein